MTKKSVKEKKKGAEGKDLPAPKRRVLERVPDLYVYAGLVFVFLFSLYLRVYRPMPRVFVGDAVLFDGNDPWYHMMLAKSTVLNFQRPWFDPLTFFPEGTAIHFGPFMSWGIAVLSYITGLGNPSMHTVEVVGAVFPAILGALLVFPVYFLGRELGGRAAGLIAAVMIAVLPGQLLSRSVIGFTDHHVAEVLFSATAILFFILAVRSGSGKLTFATLRGRDLAEVKRPLLYAILAGLFLGLYIDSWAAGHVFVGFILAFVAIQSTVDHLRGRNVDHLAIVTAIAFLIALILVLPFVRVQNGFSPVYYSLFQPVILIMGILFVLFLSFVSTELGKRRMERRYFPLVIIGSIAVVFVVLAVAVPQFTGTLMSGLKIFQPYTGGAATISEASTILERYGVQRNFPGLISILSPMWLTLLALPLLLRRYLRDEGRSGDMLILVWTVMMLSLTLAQNRFAYYYAVNVAFLTGYLGSVLLEKTRFSEVECAIVRMARGSSKEELDRNRLLMNAGAVVIVAALFVYPAMFGAVQGVSIGSFQSERHVNPIGSDWYDSLVWLRENTPYPGMDLYAIYERPPAGERFAYPDSAYGTISWWDYGHWIETIGHRLPNSNPFQQGIGNRETERPGSSPFFLAQTEAEAEAVLAALDVDMSPYSNARYVVTDVEMAMGKFHAMAAWSNIYPGEFQFSYWQDGQPITIYRTPYFRSMVARLHFFDGTEAEVQEGWTVAFRSDGAGGISVEPQKRSRDYQELLDSVDESLQRGYAAAEVVSQSPIMTSVPLEALSHYRLVYESQSSVTTSGQKYVKIFEHVPGATISGEASPGTEAVISVPITTNRGRSFVYKQSTVADSDGEFSLVVPYSTEGPEDWSTNFETGPAGPYTLQVGAVRYDVRVPEGAVIVGSSIEI
ncbi:oligosaccharyl transferase, archaeosortase A system-associated [Methanotrichaceae archaeon M04Ac]|uniref:dolichyl-phosphooligosaccharide-protein glycotransferase n=1 Tax=Candidatus Methanocrinis alkalitolerans TaxID=3033395 RepID=A0ABT5XD22_9EURY|nr:oligosaccharyl transferase, archaeosortase A system-associated [Candidatus Methanocrinis alkalitolerans]MCR3883411.1 oligosaccharyl transferase, archaeosortase A system-associated [Methanothrix sp.]MDF0592609.1 oligosaccharyl transferase, archaeosortase A system-associated [Candidatus Methanocrinis alkalitolerans]